MVYEKQKLLESLNNCITACNICLNACLIEDDIEMMRRCIQLDIDCVAICSLTVALVARDSPFTQNMKEACLAACKACADECGKHEHDHCVKCSIACKHCEETCMNYL